MAVNYDQEKQDLTRRNFLSLTANGLIGLGLLGAAGVFGKFFWPNVSYGPPTAFSIGKPTNFPDGAKQNIADQKVSIIRHGDKLGAISMVCQHLGCTVAASPTGYDCPCHGSKYDDMGNVTHGPALIALYWFDVHPTPSGDLEVDKSKKNDPFRWSLIRMSACTRRKSSCAAWRQAAPMTSPASRPRKKNAGQTGSQSPRRPRALSPRAIWESICVRMSPRLRLSGLTAGSSAVYGKGLKCGVFF